MKCFNNALEYLFKVEFSNKSSKALHKNSTEDKLTFCGIYEGAYPNWEGWSKIHKILHFYDNINIASMKAFNSIFLRQKVKEFYRDNFWDKMRLNEIENCHKRQEIFLFAVNVGVKNSTKVVQELVGTKQDGIIGKITLGAINNFNDVLFDRLFDLVEEKYYQELVLKNDKFKRYLEGWKNRTRIV